MKNIFYLSLLAVLLATSCDDPGRDTLFPADASFVELNAATTVTGIQGFLYLRENDGIPKPSDFEVTLSGQHRSSPTNVSFEVASSSTAIEGVHYSVSSNSVAIPANASTAQLPIMINADNIEAGETWTIVVRITSADVDISPLYDEATHNIQITCNSDIAGTYDYVSSGLSTDGCCPTTVNVNGTVTITAGSSAGEYEISDFSMGLYDAWYGPAYGLPPGSTPGFLRDVCDAVSIFNTIGPYSSPITGTGVRDGITGVITYSWTNDLYADVGTATLTPQ